MCLENYNEKKTNILRKSSRPITSWKVLLYSGKNLISPYYRTRWNTNEVKNSSRRSLEFTWSESFYGNIDKGIHTFSTRKAAREFIKLHSIMPYKILKVVANPEDLVGVGLFDNLPCMAFMRVTPVQIMH